MSIKKPMLAAPLEDIKTLRYPVLCTPKLDGIRLLNINGRARTRSFNDIPNNYIREIVERVTTDGYDGEVIIPGKKFTQIESLVMSEDGEPNFTYMIFDYCIDPSEPYINRIEKLGKLSKCEHIEFLLPVTIYNEIELLAYEKKCLAEGYEGVIIRSYYSPYKYGRSTSKQGYMLKMKKFTDAEATILDSYEMMSNQNIATVDALGHTKRSSHISGKVLTGMLGGFFVRDIESGIEFKVGSGFDNLLREEVWKNKDKYIGKIIKYKFQEYGTKDKPRLPIFLGFRDKKDM